MSATPDGFGKALSLTKCGLLASTILIAQVAFPVFAQTPPRPSWIEALPERTGRLYALGVASLTTNEAEAIRQASQNAKVEVVSRLRSSVKSETTLQASNSVQRELGGPTSASSRQAVAQNIRINAQAMDLPGLVVAETWVDAPKHVVYALGYLDVASSLMDIQGRLEGIRKASAVGPALGTQELARSIQRLKKNRAELDSLEPWVDLLAVGSGSTFIRSDLQTAQRLVQGCMDEQKAQLTLHLDVQKGLPGDLATLVKNAALSQGLGWSETRGEVRIRVSHQVHGDSWWSVEDRTDFITVKGIVHLTFITHDGLPYVSAPIEATGLGTSDLAAHQALLKDCQKKLGEAFDRWLNDLAI